MPGRRYAVREIAIKDGVRATVTTTDRLQKDDT